MKRCAVLFTGKMFHVEHFEATAELFHVEQLTFGQFRDCAQSVTMQNGDFSINTRNARVAAVNHSTERLISTDFCAIKTTRSLLRGIECRFLPFQS
jgi:hypothetical protein